MNVPLMRMMFKFFRLQRVGHSVCTVISKTGKARGNQCMYYILPRYLLCVNRRTTRFISALKPSVCTRFRTYIMYHSFLRRAHPARFIASRSVSRSSRQCSARPCRFLFSNAAPIEIFLQTTQDDNGEDLAARFGVFCLRSGFLTHISAYHSLCFPIQATLNSINTMLVK